MDERNPSEVEDEGKAWIWSGAEDRVYFEKHDVLWPDETGEEDIPNSSNENVEEIDREALKENILVGKWNIFVSESEVDGLWQQVKEQIEKENIWKAKVSTKWSKEDQGRDKYVIIVYTPNYFDKDDIFRVRKILKEELGIERKLYYKPDIYTRKDIYSGTAEKYGLDSASRYSG